STGGGVYSRTDKEIPLSAECQRLLGVSVSALQPETVVQKLLTLDVDLLWNGGVRAFGKASGASNTRSGGPGHTDPPVDAVDVRAKIIAEGGKLGLTQRARVEYARRGGRINTDAIDNSAGVDLSDHEVNLKILLAPLVAQGMLSTLERNRLLRELANEV